MFETKITSERGSSSCKELIQTSIDTFFNITSHARTVTIQNKSQRRKTLLKTKSRKSISTEAIDTSDDDFIVTSTPKKIPKPRKSLRRPVRCKRTHREANKSKEQTVLLKDTSLGNGESIYTYESLKDILSSSVDNFLPQSYRSVNVPLTQNLITINRPERMKPVIEEGLNNQMTSFDHTLVNIKEELKDQTTSFDHTLTNIKEEVTDERTEFDHTLVFDESTLVNLTYKQSESDGASNGSQEASNIVCTPDIPFIGEQPETDNKSKKKKCSEDGALNLNGNSATKKTANSTLKSPLKSDNSKRAQSRSPQKSQTNTTEDKVLNFRYVNLMLEIIDSVLNNRHYKALFKDWEMKYINEFKEMVKEYQYVVFKLFMHQQKWYNIYDYCKNKNVSVPLQEDAIAVMYKEFRKKDIVETDYINEDLTTLLNLLSRIDLKFICSTFKIKLKTSSKETMIESLLRNINTQCTLTLAKSPRQVLLGQIQKRLGSCVRLRETFRKTIKKVYFLHTFANGEFAKPQDFFHNILNLDVVFPKYEVENDVEIFESIEDFESFMIAKDLKDEVYDIQGTRKPSSHELIKEIGQKAFDYLRNSRRLENPGLFEKKQHLSIFTAEMQYLRILRTASEAVLNKSHAEAEEWLLFLIKTIKSSKIFSGIKLGVCYDKLALIEEKYKHNNDAAAEIVIKALKEKENFSEIELEDVAARARRLKDHISRKISKSYHDEIVELLPEPPDKDPFPFVEFKAKTVRENEAGRKRKYMTYLENGDKEFLSVEDVALEYYKNQGYPQGVHCEGSLLNLIFHLLFHDLIYDCYVKGVFISTVQQYPLDYRTSSFFKNREEVLMKRLEEIVTMSDDEFEQFFYFRYDKYSNVSFFSRLVSLKKEKLMEVVSCLGRDVLSKILKRLASFPRLYHSGMPDLMVWNFGERKCKFVEVKSEHDKLSTKQKFWLNYLRKIGANIELCLIKSKYVK